MPDICLGIFIQLGSVSSFIGRPFVLVIMALVYQKFRKSWSSYEDYETLNGWEKLILIISSVSVMFKTVKL
jgi:hypothetical protein